MIFFLLHFLFPFKSVFLGKPFPRKLYVSLRFSNVLISILKYKISYFKFFIYCYVFCFKLCIFVFCPFCPAILFAAVFLFISPPNTPVSIRFEINFSIILLYRMPITSFYFYLYYLIFSYFPYTFSFFF